MHCGVCTTWWQALPRRHVYAGLQSRHLGRRKRGWKQKVVGVKSNRCDPRHRNDAVRPPHGNPSKIGTTSLLVVASMRHPLCRRVFLPLITKYFLDAIFLPDAAHCNRPDAHTFSTVVNQARLLRQTVFTCLVAGKFVRRGFSIAFSNCILRHAYGQSFGHTLPRHGFPRRLVFAKLLHVTLISHKTVDDKKTAQASQNLI